jgi:high affinity sulfate transporter 1
VNAETTMRWLPIRETLRGYRPRWLLRDVVAGLSVTALVVPAGMAYAQASGLPPITGLYATMLPMLVYGLVGPSRVLVLGPDSALVPLIASTVIPLSAGSAQRAVALASTLSLLTGGICVIGSAIRLGFVAELLSRPVRQGYIHGIAVTVILAQIPVLLGYSVAANGFLPEVVATVGGVSSGRIVVPALVVGAVSLAIIVLLRWKAPRLPGVLLAVVASSVAVGAGGLSAELPLVGSLPAGIPIPSLPAAGLADAASLIPAALAIAMVAYADTSVLSRSLASTNRQEVSANRELFALGAANAASGLFRGFPVSASASRTPVALSTGAMTQIAGVSSAIAIATLLVVAPQAFAWLPKSTLAAVVISAAMGLFDLRGVAQLYRVAKSEFPLMVICFVGVIVLGVLPGIALAVAISLLDFVRHSWRPHFAVLGRVSNLKGYHDVTRHPEGRQVPGLVLVRWDAPLFFANADFFADRVRQLVRSTQPPATWVVVAAEPITDVDSTAADALAALLDELRNDHVQLGFAEMKGPVKDAMKKYGLFERIGESRFYPTIGVAVKDYLRETGVAWKDWEDPG